jgi:hypothetical protein
MGGTVPRQRLWLFFALVALFSGLASAYAVPKRIVLRARKCEVTEVSYGGYPVYEPIKQPDGNYMSPQDVEAKTVRDYVCRESGATLSCASEKASAVFGEMELSRGPRSAGAAPSSAVIFSSSTALMSIMGKDYFFAIHRFVKAGAGVAVRSKECYGTVE